MPRLGHHNSNGLRLRKADRCTLDAELRRVRLDLAGCICDGAMYERRIANATTEAQAALAESNLQSVRKQIEIQRFHEDRILAELAALFGDQADLAEARR